MAILRYSETALNMRALGLHDIFAITEARITAASDLTTPAVGYPGVPTLPHVMKVDSLAILKGTSQVLAWGTGLGLDGTDLTQGRISLLHTTNFDLEHITLRASDLRAASLTLDEADDRILLNRFLRGNDQVDLGGGDDVVFAGAGRDQINDQGGADRIEGGEGDDRIFALGEGDTIDGGAGNDFIYHDYGFGRVRGAEGDDTLVSGLGRDVMTGGSGADVFIMGRSEGHDMVTDFTPGEDVLVLSGVFATTLDQTRQVQTPEGLLIGKGPWTALLLGVTALTDADVRHDGDEIIAASEARFFADWDYA